LTVPPFAGGDAADHLRAVLAALNGVEGAGLAQPLAEYAGGLVDEGCSQPVPQIARIVDVYGSPSEAANARSTWANCCGDNCPSNCPRPQLIDSVQVPTVDHAIPRQPLRGPPGINTPTGSRARRADCSSRPQQWSTRCAGCPRRSGRRHTGASTPSSAPVAGSKLSQYTSPRRGGFTTTLPRATYRGTSPSMPAGQAAVLVGYLAVGRQRRHPATAWRPARRLR